MSSNKESKRRRKMSPLSAEMYGIHIASVRQVYGPHGRRVYEIAATIEKINAYPDELFR